MNKKEQTDNSITRACKA